MSRARQVPAMDDGLGSGLSLVCAWATASSVPLHPIQHRRVYENDGSKRFWNTGWGRVVTWTTPMGKANQSPNMPQPATVSLCGV